MAKTATKRKAPPRRKPAASSRSGWAVSGWIVAAGFGAAWAGPQAGLWPHDILPDVPSIEAVRHLIAKADATPNGSANISHRDNRESAGEKIREADITPQKPVLPPIKAETIASIMRKAETKPDVASKPPLRSGTIRSPMSPSPPAAVPSSVPLVTAAIRKEHPAAALKARPGDLAIRRYPFTTAPAVAYVGDLRTIRILGGDGDWKKVAVSATGVTGWLRLQRLDAPSPSKSADGRRAQANPPRPAAGLLTEAEAAGLR